MAKPLPDLPAISQGIWEMKYRWPEGAESSLSDTLSRVARAAAAQEEAGQRAHWEQAFGDLLADLRFLPAGRILAGAGTGRAVTLFNCFVMGTIEDSTAGIFTALKEAAQTLQQGGGIGHDFSTLRPRGALVHGTGAEASGPVSFMEVWDAMCRTIMAAGARRGAMMGTLRCDHPDIEDFIAAKRRGDRLRNFNLSVLVTDAFMAAVAADADWPLIFGGEVFRTMKAAALWQAIMRATYEAAEPGVIFIDRVNAANPLSYCETISCTNPCGEQPLPPYGACLLGSLNLTRFVRQPFTATASLDETHLADSARLAVRFLDNIIGVSRYPLAEQRAEALAKRRMGLGITGLADALAMLGLTYGRPEAAAAAARWMKTITQAAFAASSEIAVEKGVFPLFNAERYLATPHGQALPGDIRAMIAASGLRNGLLTSIAPTGTISLLAGNVSSGVEPIFSLEHERRVRLADGSFRVEHLTDFAVAEWRRLHGDKPLPESFVTVNDLQPADHLAMQAALQPQVDSSISKTINVPADLPFAAFQDVYAQAHRLGLKGCTTFRPNDVTGAILTAPVSEPARTRCPACGSSDIAAAEGCTTCLSCGTALCG